MATRNERRRVARQRELILREAVTQAFALEAAKKEAFNVARDNYVSRTQDALRFHRNPSDRCGKQVGGKYVPLLAKEPAKRVLTLNPQTGRLVEKRKRYI